MKRINSKLVIQMIEATGFSRSEWCRQHGIKKQSLCFWLSGERNIKPSNLTILARELGLKEEELGIILEPDDPEWVELSTMWNRMSKAQKRAVLAVVREIGRINN